MEKKNAEQRYVEMAMQDGHATVLSFLCRISGDLWLLYSKRHERSVIVSRCWEGDKTIY